MMAAGIDWDQIFSLIAPRPVFMGYGTDDAGTPEVIVETFRKSYTQYNSSVPVIFRDEVIGHKFRMTVLQDGPDFLCKHSGG